MTTLDIPTNAVFWGGSYHRGDGGPLTVHNPSTGSVLAEPAAAAESSVDDAVADAASALDGPWSRWSTLERGRLCARIAAALLADADRYVELVVHDGGLPVSFARRDVEAAARYFEFYAGLADKLHGQTLPLGPDLLDYTMREPWGVCAVVLPFNVPLQMAARSIAAALVIGNVVVAKPPEQAPFAALALVELCSREGAPPGVVNAVAGSGGVAGARLVEHPLVDHITFTGSLATGRRIMASAAATMKPVLLELGGKSPHIVFADADVERVVAAVIGSAMRTAGQACSAGTRVLVEEPLYGQVASRLGEVADSLRVGPAPADPDVGPLITSDARTQVMTAIEDSVGSGARMVTQRDYLDDGPGYLVNPVILGTEDRSCPAAREEIFGPVVTVLPVADEEDAIALANDSDLGLVAGVWTTRLDRAHRVARQVKAGQVFVNNYGVGGGVELPFGGYRRSGFGRLKGVAGALEYSQLKNVCVALS